MMLVLLLSDSVSSPGAQRECECNFWEAFTFVDVAGYWATPISLAS
jgi:hypothetical protein